MMRFAAAAWLALALGLVPGCLQSNLVPCGDKACPANYLCVQDQCASPEQAAACAGRADGDACNTTLGDGVCTSGSCVLEVCGDGITAATEACDDGNRDSGDGCAANCQSNEQCGNGVLDTVAGEECDDGNADDTDTCHHDCKVPRCGDGIFDARFGEACDDGVANQDLANAACRTNCQPQRCGDAIVDAGEACDDGNLVPGDGCNSDCQSNETRGNGVVDLVTGETCDSGVPGLSGDGCNSTCQLEQEVWSTGLPLDFPELREPGITYDSARNVVVMYAKNFQTDPVFELSQDGYSNRRLPTVPPVNQRGNALVFDSARNVTVMLSGDPENDTLAKTWEYDGARWVEVTTAHAPRPRWRHAMVFDPVRRKVILFGGRSGTRASNTSLGDTWEYDGTDWTQMAPVTAPSGRRAFGFAWDAARNIAVLFGGTDGSGNFNDVWEYQGPSVGTAGTWTQRNPTGATVAARHGFGFVYDPNSGGIVLFGGRGGGTGTDMYVYNGNSWTAITSSGTPHISSSVFVYHPGRQRSLLINNVGRWEWNGTTRSWTAMSFQPALLAGMATVHDESRGVIVSFGGKISSASRCSNQMFEYAPLDRGWRIRTFAVAPSPRLRASMAYDAAHKQIVLFGGRACDGSRLADTWTFDGNVWSNTGASGPSARHGAMLTYDYQAKRVILFGGDNGTTSLNDTWSWDGSTWTRHNPTNSPPKRRNGGFAFDRKRNVSVLFGGTDQFALLHYSDTWQYNHGTNAWQQIDAIAGTRQYPALTYEPLRQQVVLYGGAISGDAYAYALTLAPTPRWEPIATTVVPRPPRGVAMFWDGRAHELVGLGQTTTAVGYVNNSVPREACVEGADTDGDSLMACADPDCYGVCTPSCPPGHGTCDPAFPRCGDGQCYGVETHSNCSADCP